MKKFTFILSLLIAITITSNAQWQETELANVIIRSLAVSGSNIFAGTRYSGVHLSTNNGDSWTAVNSGLTNANVRSIAISGTNTFLGTQANGVFLSTNNGDLWTAINTGLTNNNVTSLAISGTNIFAGTMGGVFLSTNNGDSWTAVNSGLTNVKVKSLVISGTNIFAGTMGGVFLSSNNGNSWTAVNTGLSNHSINTLAINGTNVFAGTSGDGIFLSYNNGSYWSAIGLSQQHIASIVTSGTIIVASSVEGVWLSNNNGNSWINFGNGLPYGYYHVSSLAISETFIFAGLTEKGVWKRPLSEIVGIEEITSKNGMAIYPNPAADFFTLKIDNDNQADKTLNIYSLKGSLVKTETPQHNQQEINISKLNAGIYIVEIKSESFSRKQKLVIQR